MTDGLARAGELAVAEALRLWQLDIYDPPRSDTSELGIRSKRHIDDLLAACGWVWEIPYKGDGQVEWCGIFAGACWRVAGIDPKWLATYFASTYRLDLWASYRSFDIKHPNPRPAKDQRLIALLDASSSRLPFEPRAGDILMIGDGNPPAGDHIAIVERYDAATKTFHTIEGNGVGRGPDGKRRQGVVRAERHLGGQGYCARRLIRPGFGDLIAENI